jgi:arabinofuranosyltransferase
MSDSSSRILPLGLAILLLAFTLWAGWFIHRSSFVVEGEHYYCLFDDAMISMTYARNLDEGRGLEWARFGDPVEGFTHPLWMFLMVPVNALPIALRDRSLFIQIFSLLALAGTAVAVRRLMIDHFSPPGEVHWLPAAVLTAFYYPLVYWSLMGMETGLQALLAVVAVQLALTTAHSEQDRSFWLWIVCAAAFLLRMDMLLLAGVAQLYVLWHRGFRQMGRRGWLAGLAVFAGMTLAYGIFRWVYYHDLLPNTYYLKLSGVPLAVRLLRGMAVMAEFVRDHLLVLLAAGAGTAAFLRRNRRLILPAAIFVLYCAYSVYVGGDAWDDDLPIRANRFVAFGMPLLFVLLNATLNEALAAWRRGREVSPGDPAGRFALAAAAVLSLLLVNGLWLSDKASDNWREMTLVDRPPMTLRHQKVVAQLAAFQRLVKPGAVVATAWAGIPAYFTDYKMIDILGYNDRVVAHGDPVTPLDEDNFDTFRPGHSKWNEQRLLTEQRPDAFFQIWGIKRGMGPVAKVLPSYGYHKVGRFWMRTDSPYVDTHGAPPPAAEEPQEPAAGGDQGTGQNNGQDSGQDSGNAGDAGNAGNSTPGAQAQLPPRARHPRRAQTRS